MFEREQVWCMKICIESNVIPRWLIIRAVQISSTEWGVQAQLKNWSDSVWPHLCLMDLTVLLSSGSKSIKGQLSREQVWRGFKLLVKQGSCSHTGSCIFVNYSFISLISKEGTSAQHRSVKYVNLYQVCSAASCYLARLAAFSWFEFSVRVFKSLSLSDFIGSFPLIINPAPVLQIREISSLVVLSLKKNHIFV